MRAYIIVDLGFGDSGKGLLTDHLVRSHQAGLVIRYNGGAQAGHNVQTPDGRQHTFSQFGAGSFVPNVKTYLSRHVVIHPTALLLEGDLLRQKGVPDAFMRLRINDQALVITPFHQAANRIREIMRGAARHGSCGVGVGEAVEDERSGLCEVIRAADLSDLPTMRRKLHEIRSHKWRQVLSWKNDIRNQIDFGQEFRIFEEPSVTENWLSSINRIHEMRLVVSDDMLQQWLDRTETVVFEGAQGVLLDEHAGFHPYTTWSRSTTENADEIIRQMAPDASVHRVGVTRSFAVRHGPGPFPTETKELNGKVSEHNTYNEWQGAVRYGWFDFVLIRYALQATSGVDSLAVTHMDILPHLEHWKYCTGYRSNPGLGRFQIKSSNYRGLLEQFSLPGHLSLSEREDFSNALAMTEPELMNCNSTTADVIETIEALTSQRVGMFSTGPTSAHVHEL